MSRSDMRKATLLALAVILFVAGICTAGLPGALMAFGAAALAGISVRL